MTAKVNVSPLYLGKTHYAFCQYEMLIIYIANNLLLSDYKLFCTFFMLNDFCLCSEAECVFC